MQIQNRQIDRALFDRRVAEAPGSMIENFDTMAWCDAIWIWIQELVQSVTAGDGGTDSERPS